MENLYYVTAISVEELTEEKLRKKHLAHNCLYGKQLTYEEYLKYLKNWENDIYEISSFISSYHLDLEIAKNYVENNLGDINEAGSYNYAAISRATLDAFYYNSCQNPETDFYIYKYNLETNKYEPLDKSTEEYNYILKDLWGFI